MAGVLSFTLGLETSNFLRNLGLASGGILGLASVGQIVQSTFRSVWAAIERGGDLADLSAQTRTSVRELYQLQEAFKEVGNAPEGVAGSIIKLQKALSGVTETGEKTETLLRGIGIEMDALRNMTATEQFSAIAAAIRQLPKEQAAGVVGRIFGREGANNILKIVGDMKGFHDVLRESAAEADVFQRNAAAFDEIGDVLIRVKGRIGGFFAGVAQGAAPAIQSALDFINAFDFVRVGEGFGRVLTAITEAFKGGRLGELINISLRSGFDAFLAVAPALFAKLGSLLMNALATPLAVFQAGIEVIIDQQLSNARLMLGFLSGKGVSSAAGDGGEQAARLAEILKTRLEEGFKINLGTGEFGIGEINEAADEALRNGARKAADALRPLADVITELAGGATKARSSAEAAKSGTDISGLLEKGQKPDVSALEKIGFVFGAGAGITADHARATADNTRNTAKFTSDAVIALNRIQTTLGFGFKPVNT